MADQSRRRAGEGLRTALWPVPTAAVLVATALGVALPELDRQVDQGLPEPVTELLFGGSADAASTLLDAIASSLITVTSLTFSLTVVTLQLASSQFSPRLLRTFTRDRFVHVTLALFLATFTYSLTVLRSVRTAEDQQEPFVPQIAVTLAFLLVLASVVALVLFLAHLAQQIRVETMLRDVHSEASHTMREVLPERDAAQDRDRILPVPSADATPLLAAGSGFLVGVDEQALLECAQEAGAVVVVDRCTGDSLVAGTPVGSAWPLAGGRLDDQGRAAVLAGAGKAVLTGFERTAAEDPGFGLRQLVDVATKALSPGINDPTTAVHALGHISALLCEVAGRDLRATVLRDGDDRVRVVLRRPTLRELLDVAVSQPRRYGASDPAVLARIAQLLRELAWQVRPQDRAPVAEQLARLRSTVADQGFDREEERALEEAAAQVDEALAGRWAPAGDLR